MCSLKMRNFGQSQPIDDFDLTEWMSTKLPSAFQHVEAEKLEMGGVWQHFPIRNYVIVKQFPGMIQCKVPSF